MDKRIVPKEVLVAKIKEFIATQDGPFSIAVVDIDNFSAINEAHGVQFGNAVIKKLTSIFKQNISSIDKMAKRGDEFNILLVRKGAERSFMEMEEIRRYLSDNIFSLAYKNKAEDIYVTLSCGIASYPRDAKNAVELFRVADSAMFRAKKLGKNRVCLSEAESMVLKSSYFTKTQVDRLAELSKDLEKTEAFLLREAVDDLFKKYSR